jgi:hypothetical protein
MTPLTPNPLSPWGEGASVWYLGDIPRPPDRGHAPVNPVTFPYFIFFVLLAT